MLAIATALVFAASTPAPQDAAALGLQLARVRAFSRSNGEALWPGYGAAPFGFLLLEAESETLLCREPAPAGFTPDGRDDATGCLRFTRPRGKLSGRFLAAMPVFGPPATIVMGTPASTGRSPAEWRRTILHEHFHQWQWWLPDHYKRVNALDLSGGDETGMWMLNYAFPYADPAAGAAYSAASLALADALAARGTGEFPAAFDNYLGARVRFEASVTPRDWRYLEFQLWQEGVARWTEIELGKQYPDAAVKAASTALEARTLTALREPKLAEQGRELAYSYGAGEAMLMAACGAAWRRGYPGQLSLKPLLAKARAQCR